MYRLPSQFDPAARHDGLSAAGGGSTSTTCSSCIVTLGATSLLTARLFASGVPGAAAVAPHPSPTAQAPLDATTGDPSATPEYPTPAPDAPLIDAASRPVIARGALILLGLFSAALASIVGLMAGAMTGAFLLGPIVGVGVFIGLYCWVFERTGRSVGRGAAIAVAVLVGTALAGAAEMAVWLSAMG